MSKYTNLSKEIIDLVGGKDNIIDVNYCLTRLRFTLKDINKADEEALRSKPEIISTAHAAGKLQVIVGNAVTDIYEEVRNNLNLTTSTKSTTKEKEDIITKLTNTITKVITPTLGVLVATGLLKGLLALLLAFKWISVESGTYIILNALGDTLFYFFPIILGYTAAETFGLNKFIGMILGGVLIYPGIMEAMLSGEPLMEMLSGSAFASTAFKSFVGVPVFFPGAGYGSTVVPIILIAYIGSKVEKFLKEKIPTIVGFAFVPFLTLLIVAPLAFIVIGPIANLLSNAIGWLTNTLFGISPLLAAAVVALIYQPLVIFGLHWPLITLAITNFGTLGYDYLWPTMFTASFAQTAVVLAVGLRTKNEKTKAMTLPALISGLMCIIEPAIYGFSLPDKKRFAYSCIGGAVGGMIIAFFNVVQYHLGIGLLGFPGFIAPDGNMRNLIIAVIATIVTMVVSFALTWITFKEVNLDQPGATTNEEILSPVSGHLISLSELNDETIQSEVLGSTVAIKPTSNKIIAPFDGQLIAASNTGEILKLRSDRGFELTIQLENYLDQPLVKNILKKVNEPINKNEELLFLEHLDASVIVTFNNSQEYSELLKPTNSEILQADSLFKFS